MNREQALNYMRSSGWSEEQINTVTEALTCEDAISRAEAIRVASGYCHLANIPDELAKLPSVTPQQKTGHWIRMKAYEKWECSGCNTVFRFTFKEHNYCPNCGAKMEVEECIETNMRKHWNR